MKSVVKQSMKPRFMYGVMKEEYRRLIPNFFQKVANCYLYYFEMCFNTVFKHFRSVLLMILYIEQIKPFLFSYPSDL